MKKNFFSFLKEKNYNFSEISEEILLIQELKKVKQNSYYHAEGNVYNHTKLVCNYINDFFNLNEFEKDILFTAALFHDIGKITNTKFEDGKIISPYHSIKGAKLFREFFYKNNQFFIPFKEREEISSLIQFHMLPPNFINKLDIDYSLIKASWCVNMKLLYLLSKADINGRIADDKKALLNIVEYFKDYSSEIDCFYSNKNFFNKYTKLKYFQDKIYYNDELFDSTSFDVIIMCGLPLSGKDTYIQKNLKDIDIISLDNLREKYKILPTDNSSKIVYMAKLQAKELLRKKTPFVWNATNIILETRQKLCKLFSNYGARVKYIYIETDYEKLLKRNRTRERTIPENVLNNMIKKIEVLQKYEGYEAEYFIY